MNISETLHFLKLRGYALFQRRGLHLEKRIKCLFHQGEAAVLWFKPKDPATDAWDGNRPLSVPGSE